MYTYTFQADLGGEFIAMPEELRHRRQRATFFVVMEDDAAAFEAAKKDIKLKPFIPTKGYKFNREEANER